MLMHINTYGHQTVLTVFSLLMEVLGEIICSYSSHLYPVNIGLHLELLHQSASLSNASSVVGGHEASGSGLLLWNTDRRIHSVNLTYG